jgi:lipoprotein-releasing system permease protein
LSIHTWREQQKSFTGPVEKERELMRTLFSIIYLVVAALILSIFWAIVYEKTRDIGILRSLGASRVGIVWIFLRYGGIIGVLGSLLGLLLGWLITNNINEIHSAMGSPPIAIAVVAFIISLASLWVAVVRGRSGEILPIVVGLLSVITFGGIGGLILFVRHQGGIVIWDASVYYFSIIPNNVDWPSASVTLIGAVLFCLLGAVIPAAKAADTDPVKALRHE